MRVHSAHIHDALELLLVLFMKATNGSPLMAWLFYPIHRKTDKAGGWRTGRYPQKLCLRMPKSGAAAVPTAAALHSSCMNYLPSAEFLSGH